MASVPKFTLLTYIFKKPILLIYAVVPTLAVTRVVDFKAAAWMLFWLFFGDLITGVAASYFDWKKSAKKDKWFFGRGEGFSSEKFKKMFVKAIVYTITPLAVNKFQHTYFIKNIKYESISDAEITVATFFILIFCINEGFSIFHENLPRCGFNLIDRIKKIAKVFWSTKKEISNE